MGIIKKGKEKKIERVEGKREGKKIIIIVFSLTHTRSKTNKHKKQGLLWETSLLDPEEGIRFRGYSIPECQVSD